MSDDVWTPYSNNASVSNIAFGTGPSKGNYFRQAILNPGTGQATLTVYDNTAQSGKIICQISALANGGSSSGVECRIPIATGISVTLTGTGAPSYVLYYE